MRELYLHIGLHKTATSYVQRLVLENRAALLAHGIGLGPHQDPVGGSHHPIIAAIARDGPETVFDCAAACPGARLLISAEDLAHELADPSKAAAIAAAASRHFKVRIVLFLRRQDHLKESVFGEVVKYFYAGSILGETHYDYDHHARVAALEAVFGRANVTLGVYGGGNDVFGGILAAMGVTLDRAALRDVTPQNVTMHRRKRLFLSQVPKSLQTMRHPGRSAAVRLIRFAVERSDAIADDGIATLMSPAERRALVAAHLDGNRALVARYRIAAPGDLLDLPGADASWHPPAPITAQERLGISREVLRACWRGRDPLRGLALVARVGPPLTAATLSQLRQRAAW